jgi:hypothetical protein
LFTCASLLVFTTSLTHHQQKNQPVNDTVCILQHWAARQVLHEPKLPSLHRTQPPGELLLSILHLSIARCGSLLSAIHSRQQTDTTNAAMKLMQQPWSGCAICCRQPLR